MVDEILNLEDVFNERCKSLRSVCTSTPTMGNITFDQLRSIPFILLIAFRGVPQNEYPT